MASPEKKARYDVIGQVKNAIERDDWAEVARILSECRRRDSDSVMTQLVSRDQWDAVKQVIRCVGDEERTWSIEGVLVKNNILLSVAKGNWREIGEMPHERFLHSTLDWILQQACTRAKQTDIVQYVLPHCEDDQLDSALQQLVTHGLWFAVGRGLQLNVDADRDRCVIQQACQRAEELVLRAFVIPFCHKSNLDLLMTELVSRDMWRAACAVLMRGVSFTQHCWVLKEACCRAQSWQLERIVLPYCALEHCNSATNTLVSEEQWSSVCKLLNGSEDQRLTMTFNGINVDRYILHSVASRKGLDILKLLRIRENDSKRVWSFCQNRMKTNQSYFQLYCRQHDSRLKRVRFNNTFTWTYGNKRFPEYITDLQNVFAVIIKASPKTNEQKNRVCIVPCCAGKNLDSIFTECFDKFLKKKSIKVSLQGFSDSQRTWVVGLLLGNSSNAHISEFSVSSSTAEQLYSVLRQMLSLPAWWALGKVLEQGLEDSDVTHILKQTLLYDDDQMILEHVLPHCTDSQTDLAVTELVSAGQWKSVTKLVTLVGDRKQTWTVGGTSVDTTLLHLVVGEKWKEVGDLLQRGEDDQHHNWSVQIASIATSSNLLAYVLPHCADDQLDSVLTTLVERRLWRAVGETLKRGVSDSVKQWAVAEAFTKYDEDDDYEYDDDHYAGTFLIDIILPHCADDQLDSVLTTLVERRLWRAVVKVLNRGVSDSVKRWAVAKVLTKYDISCEYDDDDDFLIYDILPHCADDQLGSLLTTLVDYGLWKDVGEVLDQGVSDSVKRWAVAEAVTQYDEDDSDYLDSDDLDYYILPHCADDQLDSVLKTLVKRRLWEAVGETLKRGVSDSVKRWAVAEAFTKYEEYYDDEYDDDEYDDDEDDYDYYGGTFLIDIILPHCADDQLDSVLKTLVKRRLWAAVEEVLNRGVSDSVKRWAVMEACQHCNVPDYAYIREGILSHCADDQLDSVLITLVKRRLWAAAGKVLNRGVSDSVKRWAVMEACQHCDVSDDDHIGEAILSHCADDQLDSVLTTLVERRLWAAVEEVLNRGVSDSVKRWAVMEACQHCDVSDDDHIGKAILSHCADDQLDSVLTTLVERRLWRSVQRVLERVAGDFNKEFDGQKTCEHCRSAVVYFSEDHVHDSDSLVNTSCTPHRANCNLKSPTSALSKTNECTAVRNMSGREVSDAQRREIIRAAFRHADEDTLKKSILPYYVYDSIQSALKMLASRGFWSAFLVLLHYSIIDTLYLWAFVQDTDSKDEVFWDMVRNPCDGVKELTPAMWRSVTWSGLQRSLKQLLDWNTPLCEVLCESLLGTVKEIWLSKREKAIYMSIDIIYEDMKKSLSIVEHLHQLIAPGLMECKTYSFSDLLSCTEGVRREYVERRQKHGFLLQLYFIKNLVLQYYKRKAWEQMTNTILVALTTVPVVPEVQSVALRVMLRHNRWDVIRHACLSGVCEQDRRQLFQAAVKQRQWSAVKRWADHTLYNDQRLWALGEARQGKRWDVYLKLADHGLSEWERVGVLFRVAMHADWKLVRHMLRTVADVTDVIDLLTNTPGALAKFGAKKHEQRMSDFKEFEEDLMNDTKKLRTLKTMVTRGKWWVVLHNIRHKPNLEHARRALKAAASSEAWHAVMQLVRLETDVTRRDSLFRDMVRLRQWAVCRELLEQGVSHYLSLELLPELIDHCQWTLVAMVMQCPIDDDRRKTIMHQALIMREGSVVWECINKLQTGLSVNEREDMFKLAFNREVWQAVKPLTEEKDVTGIRHRDTALLEAIEQHQWDVVDHCQRHHADINMKDDYGHTPIHRAARKEDWEAVKELTVRDGDPNLLDSEGMSVLHRATGTKQWDAVELLIQYHGDIHQAAQYTYYPSDSRTPLGMLMDARQKELIELTFMWCPDQWKSVSGKGETVLHAAFLSGWLDLVYYLIARRVDPLAVTKRGLTALCYAVLCKDCPQRMVAECIKLGFSTHQSRITETANSDWGHILHPPTRERMRLFRSPLVLAVIRNLRVVTQMLYESGACSNRQLFEVNTYLAHSPNYNSIGEGTSQDLFNNMWKDVHRCAHNDPRYSFDTEAMKKSADYLHQLCSTPRSLVSTCRLVISRCLTLSKTRHRDIAQLPLSPIMKNYLTFSDLTDPRYPDLSYLPQVCRPPRSLVSTCRLVISRCLTLNKTRHRDIAQLPLSPMMQNYLMFSDLTDLWYPYLSYRGKE